MQTISQRFRQFTAVIAVVALVLPCVASDKSPDPLIEAALYAQRGRSVASSCLADAIQWDRKALDSAHRFRSKSSTQRDTAGAFIANVEMHLADLKQRRTHGEQHIDAANRASRTHVLRTAADHLYSAEGMACDTQFIRVNHQLQSQRTKADELMRLANENLASHARQARKQMEQAGKIDSEIPGLAEMIESAGQLEKEQRSGPTVGTKVLTWMVLGGVVAGLAAYSNSQRKTGY